MAPSKLKTFLFFLSLSIILGLIQIMPAGFLDGDGYYHVFMARLLSQGVFLTKFPWLTATTWAQSYADQHLFYHILLIPFVKFSPIVGPQIFNALCVTVFSYIFYRMLINFNINHAKLWTLFVIFASPGFLFRISLVKAVPASLILIFLFLNFIFLNKAWITGLIAFIFVWTYGGFVFLPLILMFYLAAITISAIFKQTQILGNNLAMLPQKSWRMIIYPLIGIGLALVLFPHDGNLITQLYNQIFKAGLGYKVIVGAEWGPQTIPELIIGYSFPLLAWLGACILMFSRPKKYLTDWRLIFLFLLSLFFLLLSKKSERFIEYGVPFTVLFSALMFGPWLSKYTWDYIKQAISKNLLASVPALLGFFCFLFVMVSLAMSTAVSLHSPTPIAQFQGVADYLSSHSDPQSIVFNTQWDNFPQFLFLDSKNYYVAGMDQMFMYTADPKKYWLWNHISYGDAIICPEPSCNQTNNLPIAQALNENFHASFILVHKKESAALNSRLENNSGFSLAFQDENFALYRLNKN